MSLRRNFAVTENSHSKEMPFLQSFRQANFDSHDERNLPEIDTSLTTNGNFVANHDIILPKDGVDTNANVDIVGTEKTAAPNVDITQPKNQINYDDMYFTDDEIPVMGYTSGDENSSLQLLESREGGNEQHLHKLMPLPDDGSTKTDVLFPHLVINDLQSKIAAEVCLPEKEVIDNYQFDPSRHLSELELARKSHAKPHLVSGYPRICSDTSSNLTPECTQRTYSLGLTDTSEPSFPSMKAHLVSRQPEVCEDRSEQVKLSLGVNGEDDVVLHSKLASEGSVDSCSDSDEAAQPVNNSVSGGIVDPTTNAGMCGKLVVDLDEPIHMTLEEVRSSLRSLSGYLKSAAQCSSPPSSPTESACLQNHKIQKLRCRRMHFGLCLKPRHTEETSERSLRGSYREAEQSNGNEHNRVPSKSLKHTLCNWFGIAKCGHSSFSPREHSSLGIHLNDQIDRGSSTAITNRALPPVPQWNNESEEDEDSHVAIIIRPGNEFVQLCDDDKQVQPSMPLKTDNELVSDFASSIQKVKDCGWYWGPISGEMAEKILSNEPDGSFILRDSSDEYYIFSLTFKLNGFVRHVRIEHEQGNFSFGTFTKFKSHTIVEFIENAVEHSRSGRYLFFIHRRPVLGPMRVQLLHPVSRFKRVQSLQHICRFAILKVVRRDHIDKLPIPQRLKDYLNTQYYYTEQMQDYQAILNTGPSIQSAPSSGENANMISL